MIKHSGMFNKIGEANVTKMLFMLKEAVTKIPPPVQVASACCICCPCCTTMQEPPASVIEAFVRMAIDFSPFFFLSLSLYIYIYIYIFPYSFSSPLSTLNKYPKKETDLKSLGHCRMWSWITWLSRCLDVSVNMQRPSLYVRMRSFSLSLACRPVLFECICRYFPFYADLCNCTIACACSFSAWRQPSQETAQLQEVEKAIAEINRSVLPAGMNATVLFYGALKAVLLEVVPTGGMWTGSAPAISAAELSLADMQSKALHGESVDAAALDAAFDAASKEIDSANEAKQAAYVHRTHHPTGKLEFSREEKR